MRSKLAALAACVAAFAAVPPAAALTNLQVPGLQTALRAHGLYRGRIDGVAGQKTVRAIRAFERRAGFRADGIPDRRTRAALGRLGRPLFGDRILLRGRVGWDVSVLQFVLARRGFRPSAIDGHFGARTERALRKFQRRVGLRVDGVAGRGTLTALARAATKPLPRVRIRARATRRVRAATAAMAQPWSVRAAINYWAGHYGVDRRLARALAWMESGYQHQAVSKAGAVGVMQLTPSTWEFVETVLIGRRVPHTAAGNVRVGVAFLHHLLHVFNGNERLALGAYHQGAASVRRHGLFRQTRAFVADVLALKNRV
jgi:lysozyme family protein